MREPNPRERKPRPEMNQPIEDLDRFLAENIRRVKGVIDAVRHGHTEYTEQYPDLTEEGQHAVAQTAGEIVESTRHLSNIAHHTGDMPEFTQRLFFVSSPQPRALGSGDIIRDRFLKELLPSDQIDTFIDTNADSPVRTIRSLQAMRIHKLGEALQLLVTLADGDWTPRRADYIHATSPEHADRDDLWEVRPTVQKRSLVTLSKMSRLIIKYQQANEVVPHVVATSHFELLNHVVMDIFELSPQEQADELLQRAEHFTLYVLQPKEQSPSGEQQSEPEMIPMVIQFRGQARQVMFNIRTKQFA